jgi:hypothetical protein
MFRMSKKEGGEKRRASIHPSIHSSKNHENKEKGGPSMHISWSPD